SRPQTSTPTSSAAIHEPVHSCTTPSVWSVVPGPPGIQPRSTAGEHEEIAATAARATTDATPRRIRRPEERGGDDTWRWPSDSVSDDSGRPVCTFRGQGGRAAHTSARAGPIGTSWASSGARRAFRDGPRRGRPAAARRTGRGMCSGHTDRPLPFSTQRRETGVRWSLTTSTDRYHRLRWLGLAAISLGVALIIMDATIVSVAMPSIVTSLDLSTTQVQWVQEVYTLVFAALLLVWGTTSDRIGR